MRAAAGWVQRGWRGPRGGGWREEGAACPVLCAPAHLRPQKVSGLGEAVQGVIIASLLVQDAAAVDQGIGVACSCPVQLLVAACRSAGSAGGGKAVLRPTPLPEHAGS
jgi:hypothetical protein